MNIKTLHYIIWDYQSHRTQVYLTKAFVGVVKHPLGNFMILLLVCGGFCIPRTLKLCAILLYAHSRALEHTYFVGVVNLPLDSFMIVVLIWKVLCIPRTLKLCAIPLYKTTSALERIYFTRLSLELWSLAPVAMRSWCLIRVLWFEHIGVLGYIFDKPFVGGVDVSLGSSVVFVVVRQSF